MPRYKRKSKRKSSRRRRGRISRGLPRSVRSGNYHRLQLYSRHAVDTSAAGKLQCHIGTQDVEHPWSSGETGAKVEVIIAHPLHTSFCALYTYFRIRAVKIYYEPDMLNAAAEDAATRKNSYWYFKYKYDGSAKSDALLSSNTNFLCDPGRHSKFRTDRSWTQYVRPPRNANQHSRDGTIPEHVNKGWQHCTKVGGEKILDAGIFQGYSEDLTASAEYGTIYLTFYVEYRNLLKQTFGS